MSNVREYTIKLLEAMDEGVIDPRVVAEMALAYMSEYEVKCMCHDNDIFQDGDVEEDENGEQED